MLFDVEGALRHLLAAAKVTDAIEVVSLANATGRIVAEDCRAKTEVPPFNNSAMDGYAVCTGDVSPGKSLPVSQKIFAGDAAGGLEPGTAARLFTGSMIPAGADTVIIQEDAHEEGGQVIFHEHARPGQNIRKSGEDIAGNALLAEAGKRLSPVHLGLLASAGIAELKVYKPLKIGLLATGSELVEPGQALEPGQIYNSNQYMLAAELKRLGFIVDTVVVPDQLDGIVSSLQQFAGDCEALLSIGGVSVGEADLVRKAIEKLGSVSLWKVSMKPGKPLSFGDVDGTPLMGLPGNPVSAFTAFQLFARPFLLTMQGEKRLGSEPVYYPIMLDKPVCPRREEFLRVQLQKQDAGFVLQPYPHQGSGVLSSVAWASGFARIPMNRQTNPGDRVLYLPFTQD